MTVHHTANYSTFDKGGRIERFIVSTACGRALTKPVLLTDNIQSVTCKACLRVAWVSWGLKPK